MSEQTQELAQGSEAWFAARRGMFGASRMGDLMAKGEGKTRAGYLLELVAERLTGISCGFEGNADTLFGNEQEPHACRAYEERFACFVEKVGFLVHPSLSMAGASPDGIISGVRGLELKSHRKPITFLKAIEGAIPKGHNLQCQFGMACSGLPEWHYANWCPYMPENIRLHVRTVERDERAIAELVVAIREADIEVVAAVARYSNMKGGAPA